MKKILLATGNRELDDAIAKALNKEDETGYAFDFSTYREGLASKVSAFKPDILVMSELLNGDTDIVKLAFEIKRFYIDTRIILLLGEEYNKYLPLLVAHNIYDFIVNNRWTFETVLGLIKNPKTLNDVYNYLPDSLEDSSAQSNSSKDLFKNHQSDKNQLNFEEDLTDLTIEDNNELPTFNSFSTQNITVFEQGEKIGKFKTLVKPSNGFITSSKPKKISRYQFNQQSEPSNISVDIALREDNSQQVAEKKQETVNKPKNIPEVVVPNDQPETKPDETLEIKNSETAISNTADIVDPQQTEPALETPQEKIDKNIEKTNKGDSEEQDPACLENNMQDDDKNQVKVNTENGVKNDIAKKSDNNAKDLVSKRETKEIVKECNVLDIAVPSEQTSGQSQNKETAKDSKENVQHSTNKEKSTEGKKTHDKPYKKPIPEDEMFTCSMNDLGYGMLVEENSPKKKDNNKKTKSKNDTTVSNVVSSVISESKSVGSERENAPFYVQGLKPAYKSFVILSHSVATSQMGANLAFALAQKNKSRVLYIIHSKYHIMKQIGEVTNEGAPWAEGFEKIKYDLPKKCKVQGKVDIYNYSGRRITDCMDQLPLSGKYDYIVLELDCSKYDSSHLSCLKDKLDQRGLIKFYTLLPQDYIFMEFFKNERTAKVKDLDYTFVIERYQLNGLSTKKVASTFDRPCIKLTTDLVLETGCYVNKSLFMWKEKLSGLGVDYKELFIDVEGGPKENVRVDSMHK